MKKFILLFFILLLTINEDVSAAAVEYKLPTFTNAVVTGDILNVRNGPGTDFDTIGKLSNGSTLKVLAKVSDWYLIQTSSNLVGLVSKDYIRDANSMTDEKQLLSLINNERKKSNIIVLKEDATLNKIAKEKAQDMVKNNYFSNQSKALGGVVDMLKKYDVKFKVAGENIAGDKTVQAAFNEWLKSSTQKNNLLNRNYNYTGIAVVESKQYGKIIVQEFLGR